MARPPRLELPGVPLHVLQRGNNRNACFFGDADRRFYLRCLAEAAARRGCDIHAYVLMGNHVHLLLTPQEAGATSAMLQDVGRRYVRVINNIHNRTGTLWEGRFRSSLIDSESYLVVCHQYIELNPVRAGMVGGPADYPWSSHLHYRGARTGSFITPHPLYLACQAPFPATLEQGVVKPDPKCHQHRFLARLGGFHGGSGSEARAVGAHACARPPARGSYR